MSVYDIYDLKKSRKIRKNPDKHFPNKLEGKLLRKIMSNTGMTEKQVRDDVVLRRQLAEASKLGCVVKHNRIEKYYRSLIKLACRETKLAKEHPKTIEVLDRILNENRNGWNRPWFLWVHGNNVNAKRIIEIYK